MNLLTRSNLIGAIAGAILAGLHFRAKSYRRYFWFDNVAHFIGGVAVGGFASRPDSTVPFDLSVALGASALWELAEYEFGVFPFGGKTSEDYAAEDTVLDTIMVLLGAFIVARLEWRADE